MPTKSPLSRSVGRRPAGARAGEKVSQYRQFTVRLPDDVRTELDAIAGVLRQPAWRVVMDAVRAYVGSGPSLSEDERQIVRAVVKFHERSRPPATPATRESISAAGPPLDHVPGKRKITLDED